MKTTIETSELSTNKWNEQYTPGVWSSHEDAVFRTEGKEVYNLVEQKGDAKGLPHGSWIFGTLQFNHIATQEEKNRILNTINSAPELIKAMEALVSLFDKEDISTMMIALADLWLRHDSEKTAGYKDKQKRVEALQRLFMHIDDALLSDALHNDKTLKFNKAKEALQKAKQK